MRSEMPFHGVAAPELQAVLRPHLAAYAPADRAAWERDVRELWDGATHREERYAAIALARHRVARPWQDVALAGPGPAPRRDRGLVGPRRPRRQPPGRRRAAALTGRTATPVVRGWAGDDDLWLRRTAVLAQLRHRGATPTPRCWPRWSRPTSTTRRSGCARPSAGRCASTRAPTPTGCATTSRAWDDRISGLSRREALKHL